MKLTVTELLDEVNAKIKNSGEDVALRVVSTLVEKEVTGRSDAFLKVLGKLDELRKAERKIRPDSETWPAGPDGLPAAESVKHWSKAKKDELQNNKDEQDKLVKALNLALDGDFSKVKDLASK